MIVIMCIAITFSSMYDILEFWMQISYFGVLDWPRCQWSKQKSWLQEWCGEVSIDNVASQECQKIPYYTTSLSVEYRRPKVCTIAFLASLEG